MWYLYGFAIVAGIAGAIEPGQNATLAKSLRSALWAGLACIGLSTVLFALALAAALGATGETLPGLDQIARVPWWAWFGGVLSFVIAVAQLTVSKRIGAAPFLGILVTAGVVTSILLDHFGLVGFKVHAVNAGRLAGGALMIAGVALVARF